MRNTDLAWTLEGLYLVMVHKICIAGSISGYIQTFLLGRGHKFFVGGSGGFDDVDEEIDVRKANFFVSEASKLSAGARILGVHRALKF